MTEPIVTYQVDVKFECMNCEDEMHADPGSGFYCAFCHPRQVKWDRDVSKVLRNLLEVARRGKPLPKTLVDELEDVALGYLPGEKKKR